MKSKKITAAVLGIVLTFGLVVSGCGNNNGASSDGSAKAETNKDGYEVVNIGFPSAGYEWAEGALAVAEEKGYLDEYLKLGYRSSTGDSRSIGIRRSGLCILCGFCGNHGNIKRH